MWTLISQQFSYSRRSLLVAAIVALLFTIGLAFTTANADAEDLRKLWMLVVLLFSGGAGLTLWMTDQKERRSLLWAALPIGRREIAGARLLSTLLLHGAVLLIAFLGLALTSLVANAEGVWAPGPGAMALLGGSGFALMTMMFVHLGEEVALWVRRWSWGVTIYNGIAIAFFAVLGYQTLRGPLSYDSWPFILAMHGLAALMAFGAFQLFLRRTDLLMGVNAVTGCPENWSTGPVR